MQRSAAATAAFAAVFVLVAGLTACSDSPQSPSRLQPDGRPLFHFTQSPQPSIVCKVGPPGTYTFQVTGTLTGTLLVPNPFTLQAGQCVAVYQGSTTDDIIDISEINIPSGTAIDHISFKRIAGDCNVEPQFCATLTGTTTAEFDTFDIAPDSVFFFNKSTDVCTDQTAVNVGGPLPCVFGKSVTIGPSSMEGAIRISAGDWVNGGYSFKFKSAHVATTFTVNAFVTISGPCRNAAGQLTGTTDVITVPMGNIDYAIPASSSATDWLPSGDANSVLSWEGSIVAPANLCGGGGNQLDASKGAVYHATVAQNPKTGALVDFRFKYRDPAAKGKPNTNCLNTSDPNRAKADVCGASWSQTVTDP